MTTPMRRTTTIRARRETIIVSSRSRDHRSLRRSHITWSKRERGRRHTSRDAKSSRENSTEPRYMTKRFVRLKKHTKVGKKKFINPNSQ